MPSKHAILTIRAMRCTFSLKRISKPGILSSIYGAGLPALHQYRPDAAQLQIDAKVVDLGSLIFVFDPGEQFSKVVSVGNEVYRGPIYLSGR